jgi:hypothetical protein
MSRSRGSALALVFAFLVVPSDARAGGFALRLEATTDFPAAVGGRVAAELPLRIRASTSLGALPGGYVDVINAVVVAAGGYNDATADLIRAALRNSLIWRLQAGWRPLAARGLYFDLGYSLVTLGGGATGDQIVAAAIGQQPAGSKSGRPYDLASTLHMLVVEIGWEWSLLRDRLALRAAIGGAFTVGAKTRVEPAFTPASPADARAVAAFGAFAASYLDSTYRSYVHTPVITVGAGYRFF